MKSIKTLLVLIALFGIILVSGCAAGSATAGYSLKAGTAKELTRKGEEELTASIIKEIKLWHKYEAHK